MRVNRGSLRIHDLNLVGLIWGKVGAIGAGISVLVRSRGVRVLTIRMRDSKMSCQENVAP